MIAVAAAPTATPAPSASAEPAERGYVYAYSAYESRFADVFSGANVRYDFAEGAVRPFVFVNLTYDTRSGTPGVAEIFNDNAAVVDAGLRAPIGKNEYAYLFAVGGYSMGLRGQPDFGDVRYGIAYSREYGSMLEAQPHTQVDFDGVVYSRYQGNFIGFLQASQDAKIAGALRGIAGFNYGFDGQRLYDNNFLEGYAGFVIPASEELSLRLTAVQGSYLPRGIDRPSPASYASYRATLIFGGGVP